MKGGFYPKLALDGIRKNRRYYLPYLLTCAGMAAMHYIIAFLTESEVIRQMRGGSSMQMILGLGVVVIEVFAVLFLFYTNSFLIRRRKKELGLYNILGMGKKNIGKILAWETLFAALISLGAGLAFGIAFSKFAELALVNILRGDISYTLSVSGKAVGKTVLVFAGIFLLLLLQALKQVHLASPIALLRSENVGEKPPKANWVLGMAGAVLLAAAYAMAISIKEPLAALMMFFVAVILVIAATYLLFVAGSVAVCRILQKKKAYYYKANHFVSVSSMAYRMKRNGAGLASICILVTMVLVMISSTACLYFGEEDSLTTRYPREINIQVTASSAAELGEEKAAKLREGIEEAAARHGVQPERVLTYRYASISGLLEGGTLETDVRKLDDFTSVNYDQIVNLFFIPLADYNRMMGKDETLAEGQVLIYASRGAYTEPELAIVGGPVFEVKTVLDEVFENGFSAMDILSTLFVVVPDLENSLGTMAGLADYNGDPMLTYHWIYGLDTEADEAVQSAMAEEMAERVRLQGQETGGAQMGVRVEVRDKERADFYGTFGGLFFLGILLSLAFISAAVLMIYYKQVSEGYEDQSRFAIMQKVGMTEQEIRRSINSQILTVFFLPLGTAVLHLAFAFPMIRRLLLLFNMTNVNLFLATTGISILVFGVFYTVIYKLTSNAYYAIVSGGREKA